MNLLSLDSATAACSVAVWADGTLIAHRFEAMQRGQSEALMPMVQGAMADAGVAFGALDALAVTVGPGAYTGVRIGLAAARGLALAGGLPLVGVTTLEAVAHAMHDTAGRRGLAGRALVVALETKRADIYLQAFAADLKPLGEPMAVAPEAATLPAGPIAVAGDGAGRLLACLGDGADAVRVGGPRQDLPDAAVVAAIAAARIAADENTLRQPPPRPLYLRPPSVTLAPDRGRLRPP